MMKNQRPRSNCLYAVNRGNISTLPRQVHRPVFQKIAIARSERLRYLIFEEIDLQEDGYKLNLGCAEF